MKTTWLLDKFLRVQTREPADIEFMVEDSEYQIKNMQFDVEKNKWTVRLIPQIKSQIRGS